MVEQAPNRAIARFTQCVVEVSAVGSNGREELRNRAFIGQYLGGGGVGKLLGFLHPLEWESSDLGKFIDGFL